MPSLREERLQERVAEIRPQLAKAREIAELAESENRAITAEEQKSYDEIVAKARQVADAVKQQRHDDFVWQWAKEEFGGDVSSLGLGAKSRRLSFKGMGAKVATQMLGADGQKALARPVVLPSSARSSRPTPSLWVRWPPGCSMCAGGVDVGQHFGLHGQAQTEPQLAVHELLRWSPASSSAGSSRPRPSPPARWRRCARA